MDIVFDAGDCIAIWQPSTGHKMLVSIVGADKFSVHIEFGPRIRRQGRLVTYDKLTRRSDGQQVTYQMVKNGGL